MKLLKWLFGSKKEPENVNKEVEEERKSIYLNYDEATQILVNKYGFKYGGKGDNSEECFYKNMPLKGQRDERVFLHPMFCSFSMDGPDESCSWINRPHDVSFRSSYWSESSQKKALEKLFEYLDKYSVITIESQTQ